MESNELSEFAKLIREGKEAKKQEEENKKKDFFERYNIEKTEINPFSFISELAKLKQEAEQPKQEVSETQEEIVEEVVVPVEPPKTASELLSELANLIAEGKKGNAEAFEAEKENLETFVAEVVQDIVELKEEEKVVEVIEKEEPVAIKNPEDELISKTVESITKVAENTNLFTTTETDKTSPNFKSIQSKLKSLEQWVSRISNAGPGSGSYWLNDLGDTDKLSLQNATDNQVLTFDASIGKWVAADATGGGTGLDQFARDTANGATDLAQSAYDFANTIVVSGNIDAYARSLAANAGANTVYTFGVDATQNTNITNAINLAQAAYDYANTIIDTSIDQYARDTANSAQANTIVTQGIDVVQNTRLNSIETINTNQNTNISIIQGVDLWQNNQITYVNQFAQSAYDKANSFIDTSIDQYARDTANSASSNTIYNQGVDNWQNTQITTVNNFTQSAYDRANVQPDWNAASSSNSAFILNKPAIPTTLDSLTDVTIAVPTTGQILTYSSALGQWINQAPSITANNFTTGYFGGFYSANTLALSSTTTAYLVPVSGYYDGINGITLGSNNDIIFAYAGTYRVEYSIQLTNEGNADDDVDIWVRQNGENLANTNSVFTVSRKNTGSSPGNVIAVTPFLVTVEAGDRIQVMASSTFGHSVIKYYPSDTTPAVPATPSVIINVEQVAGIIIPNDIAGTANNANYLGNVAASGYATNAYAIAAFSQANTASANTILTQGVDAWQNTQITEVNQFAQSAYDKANTTTVPSSLANSTYTVLLDEFGTLTTPGTIKTNRINNTGSTQRIVIDPDDTNLAYVRVDGSDEGGERVVISNQLPSSLGMYYYTETGTFRMYQDMFGFPDATWQTTAFTGVAIDQTARDTANTSSANTILIQGVDVTQNTRLDSLETVNTNQNNSITIIQGVDLTQNTQIAGIQGVDNTQNTNITRADSKAQSAFDKANTAITTSGGTANASITANALTAFIAGDNAISGVALQLPSEGALRNLTNGLTNMYFDVSIGGSTNGQFQFRSSSSYTNVLTMSPTAFNVNAGATVTSRTPSLGRLPWNSAIDTELTIDDYRFRVSNQGGNFPQIISNTGGAKNSAWTSVSARSGSAIAQTGSTGTLVPNNSWTSLYSSTGMDSAGDTVTVTLQDKNLGRIYRVTFMRSDNGSTTGYNIIAERLL